jgi:hypothetical protein
MPAKKTAAKVASRPAAEPEPRDVLPHLQAWADARDHIRAIDAQTGADSSLAARDRERLTAERAGYVEAQTAAETALA